LYYQLAYISTSAKNTVKYHDIYDMSKMVGEKFPE